VTKPLSLSVDADAMALAPMRRALDEWLTQLGADQISDVVLAVDEAVANAIEHAGLSTGEAITVDAHVVGDMIHVEVCDHGLWKEPRANDARGRGLLIMNTVMDGVSIEHRASDTRIVMSRRLR
jgi:anti-sigma regulatory factor (Ser/Thr protein kinase)